MIANAEVTLPRWFDDLQIGIVAHEPETGAILDVNERLERLYGYSAAELREMQVEAYTAPSGKFSGNEVVRRIRAAAAGDPQRFEWQVERANGELIWVGVHLTSTTIDATSCVVAEIRDITEHRTREQRSHLLNRVVRHNLRNETNILMGYADQVERGVEEETLEKQIETIRETANEIGGLSDSIRQVDEITDPEASRRTPTNVDDLVHTLVEEARTEHPAADLSVDVRANFRVNADIGLNYAIEHAIENAIVHADAETPAVTVVVAEDAAGGRGEIRIVDANPPIPDVEIEVLDGDVTTSSLYHGSGVGLWVMQLCVDTRGGELAFERRSPRGNVVRFSLPQYEPASGVTDR